MQWWCYCDVCILNCDWSFFFYVTIYIGHYTRDYCIKYDYTYTHITTAGFCGVQTETRINHINLFHALVPFYKFKWIQLIFCDCSNVFNDGPLFTLHITAQFRAGNQKVASSSPIRSKPWPITIVALSKALNPRFLQGDCPCNMSALSSSGGNLC